MPPKSFWQGVSNAGVRRAVFVFVTAFLVPAKVAAEDAPPPSTPTPAAACAFRTEHTRDYLIPLRLEPGAPPFALLQPQAELTVKMGTTESGGALLVTSFSEGVLVEGVVKRTDVELHPTTAALADGYLVLLAGALLEVQDASASDRLEVSYQVPNEDDAALHVRPKRIPRASLPCSAVDLADGEFDVTVEGAEDGWLSEQRDVPLAATQGGPTVATIRTDERLKVAVLEQRPQTARIFFERATDAVVGWVPRWSLRHDVEEWIGFGRIGTLGHGAGVGVGQGFALSTIRCPHAVPLIVEQPGYRRTVGIVDADTTVGLEGWRGGDAEIRPRTSAFVITDDAHFLLESVTLRDCQIHEPPRSLSKEHRMQSWPSAAPQIRPEPARPSK